MPTQLRRPTLPGEAVERRFQVLSLDGGGAKALFSAHVLARLEMDLQTTVIDSFDLIAGTSAGAIIALALGQGKSPAEIVHLFETLVGHVFPRTEHNLRTSYRRLFRSGYDSNRLRDALASVFADSTLGQSEKRLVVPTWDAQRGRVYLFKTAHHEMYRRDWRLSNVDVALASTAAPTYFNAANIDGQRFVDGGLWANNPSTVAIAEAVGMLDVDIASVRVLSVGTTVESSPNPKQLDDRGILSWAPHVVRLVLAAGNSGGEAMARTLVGTERYVRFDAMVPPGAFKMDRADRGDMAGFAAAVSRSLSPAYAMTFAGHIAPAFVPLYG